MIEQIRNFVRDIPLMLYRMVNAYIQDGYFPSKVLVIVAHPDDPEHFFAGTVASWVKGGSIVRYVICTSGQIGSQNHSLSMSKIAEIREREQIAAAEVIGVDDVVFLRHPDGLLENSLELRRQLVREIRIFRPEVVMINDPNIFYGDNFINHPDHRAAGAAGLEAVFPLSGMPLLFTELEEERVFPHQVRKVYIQSWQRPNTWVDVGDTIDLQIAALKKHASQMNGIDPSEELRAHAVKSAQYTRLKYSETFRVIELMSEEAWKNSLMNAIDHK